MKKNVVKMLGLKYFSYFCNRISIFFEKIFQSSLRRFTLRSSMNTTRILNLKKVHCGSMELYNGLIHSLIYTYRGAKGMLLSEV